MEYVIVMTATDSERTAESLAAGIVDARLAACVQIQAVRSFYRWDGKMNDTSEFLLNIKTTEDKAEDVKDFIARNHPYQVPEIIVLPIKDGSEKYFAWIRKEVDAAP